MCTLISLKANNGDVVTGRTEEFANYYYNDIVTLPRNYKYTNSMIFGGTKQYQSKYAVVGQNIGDAMPGINLKELIGDGMNEKGLSLSFQYYPGCNKYKHVSEFTEEQMDYAMMAIHILGNYATISEVIEFIEAGNEKEMFVTHELMTIPEHFMVIDRSGRSIVCEPDEPGKIIIKEGIGIMTNSPDYAWHIGNLRANLGINQFEQKDPVFKGVDGNKLTPFGISGAYGLPGDTSPGSRFIRAAYLRETTTKSTLHTAEETVLRLWKIFNLFEIVPGMAVKEVPSGTNLPELAVETDFENTICAHNDHVVIKDLTNLKFYYRDWTNQSIRYIDLNEYLEDTEVKSIKIAEDNAMKYQKITLK